MEETTARFTSEITYDPQLFREHHQMVQDNHIRGICARLYLIFFSALLIILMDDAPLTWIFLIFAAVFSILEWHRHQKYCDGGLEYRQLMHQYAGNIPGQLVLFHEDRIVMRNMSSGNEIEESYQSIRKIWESNNLILLVTDLKLFHLIDKRKLSGGTSEDLLEFLRTKQPNLKHAKGRLGRFVRRMLWVLIVLGVLVAAMVSIPHQESIPETAAGEFNNATPYEEIISELSKLDITISKEVINTLTVGQIYFKPGSPSYLKTYLLLIGEGDGTYFQNGIATDPFIPGTDPDTIVWSPSTSGVYYLRKDAIHERSIYTDFLNGVDAMSDTFSFSNITEDYSNVGSDATTGSVQVCFDYLDQHYSLEAEYSGSRFDTKILFAVSRILHVDTDPKDIWICVDVDQNILLYYGTKEQADTLQQKSGLVFYDCFSVPLAP